MNIIKHFYIIPLLAFMAVNLAQARVIESDKWHDRFDRHFKKYSKRYFGPHFEWRWFKSQGIAESNLNEHASSPVGAKGVMQIMPATFEEIKGQNPTFVSLKDPRWNIAAGIFYDRQLYRKWRKPLPSDERLFLAFSGYNAGYGRVLKAIKRTRNDDYSWVEVKKYLPAETRGYVSRIATLMDSTNRHRKTNLRRFENLFK